MIVAPELPEALERLSNILGAMKVRYALGGAVAMSFHGYVRATRDLDVLVLIPTTRTQEFADALTDAGFGMRDEGDKPVAVEVERAIPVPLEDFDVFVTTAEDLILLKMVFHRDKDLVDVRRLLAANATSLDFEYVESWIPRTLESAVGEELRKMMAAARCRS